MLQYVRGQSLIVSVGRYSGLGNRMRTVLGGQSLAELEQRRFFYCWPTGRKFGASLEQLWKYHRPRVSRSISRTLALRYPYRGADLTWLAPARDERIWQIRSGQPLSLPAEATPWPEQLRALRPTDEIADQISELFDARLRGRPYVGVMVRAHPHSHQQTREKSPVGWFTNRMHEIRAAVPEMGFYVSCDVPEVQDRIIADFDDTWGLPKSGAYNSTVSLQAAVVDTYLLASAVHILGPHYSSFPELALHLADDNVVLETAVNGSGLPGHRLAAWPLAVDPTRPAIREVSRRG